MMQGKKKDISVNLEKGELVYSGDQNTNANVPFPEALCHVGDTFTLRVKCLEWSKVAQVSV